MQLYARTKEHLKENNMTYREHWKFAISHGFLCIEAGILLIVHSFFPCFFERAGSILVKRLNRSFNQHKKETRSVKMI